LINPLSSNGFKEASNLVSTPPNNYPSPIKAPRFQFIYTEFTTSFRFRVSVISNEATLPNQGSLHIFKIGETPQI
jgi:hypothetical protein